MQNKNVLHIVTDQKFIDDAYFVFDQVKGINNTFIIIGDAIPLKYIKNTPINFVAKRDLLNYLLQFEIIFLHSLKLFVLNYINKLKRKKKIIVHWIGFGFDYYNNFIYKGNNIKLYKDSTYKLIGSPKGRFGAFGNFFFSLKRCYQVRNIDYFLPVLETEYNIIKKRNLLFKPKFKNWNYGYVGKIIPDVDRLWYDSNKYILLGNSASPSNNHIDALESFKKQVIDYQSYTFIIPLSYGDENYRSMFKRYLAKSDFSYQILEDFIPIEEYSELIKKCKNIIMPHLRQQGLGNILAMMMYGANVFLYKENPLYDFFILNDCKVFDISQIDSISLKSNLSNSNYQKISLFIRRHWGLENILSKTTFLFNL